MKMKRTMTASLMLVAAIASAPAFAAPAQPNACAEISRQLAGKAAEFVKVNADGRNTTLSASAKPVDFYRSVGKRDAALQAIAADVWTMRADMASRNCSQAAGFTY
jgi:hypothetical protein